MKGGRVAVWLALIIGVGFAVSPALFPSLGIVVNWGLMAALLALLLMLAFFFRVESVALGTKEIALVSMLAAMSAFLRIPFAAIPSVQPSSFLIICSGYVFGSVAGFTVGAMTPLVSNFFLGQGPWTLYQMLAWGLMGCAAGYLKGFSLGRKGLVVFGIVSAYVFGFVTDVHFWLYFTYPLTLNTLALVVLSSFPFDTAHAAGNAVFLGLFGARTVAILERYRTRFSWVHH